MTWRHAFFLANRELRRRAGRAVLTVLAVALASALLTALVTIALTAETRVLDELASGGPLSGIRVAAARPDPTQLDQDEAVGGQAAILDQQAVDRIAALPAVDAVVPVGVVRAVIDVQAPRRDGSRLEPFQEGILGVDITRVASLPVTVLSGRLPAPGATTEVTVDEGFLQRLGYDRTAADVVVGTTVQIATVRPVAVRDRFAPVQRWTRALIVGVVAQDAAQGQVLASSELVDDARRWAVDGVDGVDGAGGGLDELDPALATPYGGVFVIAESMDDVGQVRVAVAAIGYSTSAPENLIASVDRYLHVVEIVLTSVGLIALAVAAIGIANATLAAVRERRREIGVLKAVGASDRDVRRVFLVESATLGVLGGALGAVLGFVVSAIVATVVNRYLVEQGFTPVPVEVPVRTMAAVVVGSALLAVLAGILPAATAARLPAREAMGSL